MQLKVHSLSPRTWGLGGCEKIIGWDKDEGVNMSSQISYLHKSNNKLKLNDAKT
jgi:hypothetical protein